MIINFIKFFLVPLINQDIFSMHNRDHKILELLYEEAKYNILTGRYPCEISDYIMLGGIQARLELGPYDMAVHTPSYFRTIMYRLVNWIINRQVLYCKNVLLKLQMYCKLSFSNFLFVGSFQNMHRGVVHGVPVYHGSGVGMVLTQPVKIHRKLDSLSNLR